MSDETLIRLTERGKWHAVPYGDSYNETRTLCGLSFCCNQIEREEFDVVDLWNAGVCEKCADKWESP